MIVTSPAEFAVGIPALHTAAPSKNMHLCCLYQTCRLEATLRKSMPLIFHLRVVHCCPQCILPQPRERRGLPGLQDPQHHSRLLCWPQPGRINTRAQQRLTNTQPCQGKYTLKQRSRWVTFHRLLAFPVPTLSKLPQGLIYSVVVGLAIEDGINSI